jgi:RNA polymerase sigma-70 factor, ECF subfamily
MPKAEDDVELLDTYRRLGRTAEARSSYEKALALTRQEPERQLLQERIRQLK